MPPAVAGRTGSANRWGQVDRGPRIGSGMLRLVWCSLAVALAWGLLGCAKLAAPPAGDRGAATPPGADAVDPVEGEGLVWLEDYEAAIAQAKEAGRVLMVNVSTPWCKACKHMDDTVYSRSDIAEASRDLVLVRVNADERQDVKQALAVSGYPTVIFLSPEDEEVGRVRGAVPAGIMLEQMSKAVARAALAPASDE